MVQGPPGVTDEGELTLGLLRRIDARGARRSRHVSAIPVRSPHSGWHQSAFSSSHRAAARARPTPPAVALKAKWIRLRRNHWRACAEHLTAGSQAASGVRSVGRVLPFLRCAAGTYPVPKGRPLPSGVGDSLSSTGSPPLRGSGGDPCHDQRGLACETDCSSERVPAAEAFLALRTVARRAAA